MSWHNSPYKFACGVFFRRFRRLSVAAEFRFSMSHLSIRQRNFFFDANSFVFRFQLRTRINSVQLELIAHECEPSDCALVIEKIERFYSSGNHKVCLELCNKNIFQWIHLCIAFIITKPLFISFVIMLRKSIKCIFYSFTRNEHQFKHPVTITLIVWNFSHEHSFESKKS